MKSMIIILGFLIVTSISFSQQQIDRFVISNYVNKLDSLSLASICAYYCYNGDFGSIGKLKLGVMRELVTEELLKVMQRDYCMILGSDDYSNTLPNDRALKYSFLDAAKSRMWDSLYSKQPTTTYTTTTNAYRTNHASYIANCRNCITISCMRKCIQYLQDARYERLNESKLNDKEIISLYYNLKQADDLARILGKK